MDPALGAAVGASTMLTGGNVIMSSGWGKKVGKMNTLLVGPAVGINTGVGGTTVGETTGLNVNTEPPVEQDRNNEDN